MLLKQGETRVQVFELYNVLSEDTRWSQGLATAIGMYRIMGEATLRALDAQAPSPKSKLCYEEQISTVCAPPWLKSRHPPRPKSMFS